MRKTKLGLESCCFGFEGIRDQDDERNEKKRNHKMSYGRKEKMLPEKNELFQYFQNGRIKSWYL